MAGELMSALNAALGLWVCKKDESSAPALLTDPDIHDLIGAIKAGLSQPPSPEGVREWGNLRELTKNWIVQQKPGTEPQPLQLHDFEQLATLIPQELPDTQTCPAAVYEELVSQNQSESDPVCQSEAKLWAREAPDLVFAREHLERCL